MFCDASGQPSKEHININLPIPIEVMVGTDRFTLQTLINKSFTATSKFSLFSVTTASSSYNNDLKEFDFVSVTSVGYHVYKGISVSVGMSKNVNIGFNPTAGLVYTYASPSFLFVINPSFNLSYIHNPSMMSLLECKPQFNKGRGLYSRLQGMYNYDTKKGEHGRSFVNIRAGPSYKQFAIGLGSNLDWYGPNKVRKDNYGIFLRYSFL